MPGTSQYITDDIGTCNKSSGKYVLRLDEMLFVAESPDLTIITIMQTKLLKKSNLDLVKFQFY